MHTSDTFKDNQINFLIYHANSLKIHINTSLKFSLHLSSTSQFPTEFIALQTLMKFYLWHALAERNGICSPRTIWKTKLNLIRTFSNGTIDNPPKH